MRCSNGSSASSRLLADPRAARRPHNHGIPLLHEHTPDRDSQCCRDRTRLHVPEPCVWRAARSARRATGAAPGDRAGHHALRHGGALWFRRERVAAGRGVRRLPQPRPPGDQVRHDRRRWPARHRRATGDAQAHLPGIVDSTANGRDRPLVSASLGQARSSRGKHRRNGGHRRLRIRARDRAFGGLGGHAAARQRGASGQRRAERVFALEPQSGAGVARSLP